MATVYNGTLYEPGSVIPGHVNDPINHNVWYDASKKYDSNYGIFEELGISEIRYLGEDESNNKTYDEIMNSIMQYLNLHMIQIGYDIFIFDWHTPRHKSTITWRNINSSSTRTNPLATITITKDMYRNNDTNISIDDVYNKISATCEIDNDMDFLKSPLDSSELFNVYPSPERYMTEYIAPRNGEGRRARDRFIKLMLYNKSEAYTDDDKMQSKWCDWWFALRQSKNWKFKYDGGSGLRDCYAWVEHDQYGNKINQWRLANYLQWNRFFSCIISFGHGDPITLFNQTNQQNITSFTDYIAINISGDPVNNRPNASDLQNIPMSIEYENNKMYNYTPIDNNVTNYIIFSGKMELTPWQQKTGQGDGGTWLTEDNINMDTHLYSRQGISFKTCEDFIKNNARYPANYSPNMGDSAGNYNCIKNMEVPGGSESDRDEQYYQQLFYCNEYNSATPTVDKTKILVSPPIDGGKYYKKLKYGIGRTSYYKTDEIPYIPIIECELKIGDKYWVEYDNGDGSMRYGWFTAENLPTYYDDVSQTNLKKHTFSLGFNPQKDEYIIGEMHDIYNNITTDMMLSSTGTAIPITHNDHLSGTLSFKILGPVNITWDNGIRRHPTWFRSETLTANYVDILPHVQTLFIESFDIKFESDNGKIKDQNTKDDLVYESDETKQYINKKDDITFDINTALTSDEAYHYNVDITTNKNNVLDSDSQPILAITDTNTHETDKPEKIYVDAYYNEYSNPKLLVETTLEDDPLKVNMFYKYSIGYMNKTFAPVYINRNLANNSATIKLKEI